MLESSVMPAQDLRESKYLGTWQIRVRYGLSGPRLADRIPPDTMVPWGPDKLVGRWRPETIERYLSDRAEAKARAVRERMERRSACVEEHPVEVVGGTR
jgi:hypothetical protein